MKEQKEYLRKLLLEKRSKLTAEEAKEKSISIIGKLKELDCFKEASVILAYTSIRNEVDTSKFIKDCLNRGRMLCLPMVLKNERKFEIYKINDLNRDLHTGCYGINEPIPIIQNKLSPRDIELVVVPGIGFDIEKNRLGYGKGYYDRFLTELCPKAIKIGLTYDSLILTKLPTGKYDIKMDIIVTEKRVIV